MPADPIHGVRRILVFRGGALGDFILTLPAIAALRRRFPAARLEILGYPAFASLAEAAGLADAIHPIEAPALAPMFIEGAPQLPPPLFHCDLAVSYLYDPALVFERNFLRHAPGAQFIRGPHRPDERANIHAADALLAPLRELQIFDADPQPRLNLGDAKPADAGAWLALHPGSGSEAKNWPETHWRDLLGLILANTSWNCLLIGGEAEGERLRRLAPATSPRVRLAQNLPLVELARQMARCAGFIGHDSGVTHLAAALGLPGVVLWGPSNIHVWRPRSDKMKIVRDDAGLSALAVHRVFGEIRAARFGGGGG